MVATGVKVFERQESKDAKGSFRICQEGLAPLLPHITKQLLEITLSEFLRLLAYRSLPIPLWPGEVDRQAAQAADGENGAAVSGGCGRRRDGGDQGLTVRPRSPSSAPPSRRQEEENGAEALYKQPMADPRSLAGLEGVGLGCCVVVLRRAEAETNVEFHKVELVQELGQLSAATRSSVSLRSNPLAAPEAVEEGPTVVAYAAKYNPGYNPATGRMPPDATVFIKEFPLAAVAAGVRELEVAKRLSYGSGGGLPGEIFEEARALVNPDLPVAQCLGCFVAETSRPSPRYPPDMVQEAVYLVYKFERLMPLTEYAAFEQPPGPWWQREADPAEQRKFLKTVMWRALAALDYAHEMGVAHCALSASCLMLSTFEHRQAKSGLLVKLDNWGFGLVLDGVGDGEAEEAKARDLRSLGLALLSLVFEGTAGGPAEATSEASLGRLLELFPGDMDAFRDYCGGIPEFEPGLAFLEAYDNAGVGWDFFDIVLNRAVGRPTDLETHPFLAEVLV